MMEVWSYERPCAMPQADPYLGHINVRRREGGKGVKDNDDIHRCRAGWNENEPSERNARVQSTAIKWIDGQCRSTRPMDEPTSLLSPGLVPHLLVVRRSKLSFAQLLQFNQFSRLFLSVRIKRNETTQHYGHTDQSALVLPATHTICKSTHFCSSYAAQENMHPYKSNQTC